MTEDKEQKISEKIRRYLKNTKNYLAKKTERTAQILKKRIRKCRKKSSWVNIPVLLTNITSLLVFCSMSYMLAEYEGKEKLYIFSVIAIIITVFALIWETICLIGTRRFRKFSYYARSCPRRLIDIGRKHPIGTKAAIYMVRTVVLAAVVFHFCWHDTCYYASVQEVYGIPNGVGEPLSPKERKERAGYWKIEDYPFRKCVVLTYVEGYGQMGLMRNYSTAYGMNLFETPARMVITYEQDKEHYHSDWSVWQAAGRNRYRVPVQVRYYENEKLLLELERDENDYGLFTITTYSGEDMPQLLGSTLLRVPDDEKAEEGAVFPQIDVACSRGWENGMTNRQIEVVYNAGGLPQTRRLASRAGNLYGVNGEQYDYDRHKRLSRMYYIDADGNPICNKLGIMMVTFEYKNEKADRPSAIRYYGDMEGVKKTEGFYGVFCERFTYDDNGNVKERRQLDRSENWTCDSNGVYQYEYDYDAGRLTEESFCGVDEKAVWKERGYASFLDTYENGKLIETRCYDTEGNLTLRRDRGYAVARYVYDEFGQCISSRYYGTDEKPIISTKYHCAGFEYGYDERGNETEVRYIGLDGELMVRSDLGYAREVKVYDADGNQLEGYFYDTEGEENPAVSEELGCSSYINTYENGNWIEGRYYDTEGNLTLRSDEGYAKIRLTYDEMGQCLSEYYYDTEEKPVISTEYHCAGFKYKYDEKGNQTEVYFIGPDGNLMMRDDLGYAWKKQVYDAEGNLLEAFYYNAEGNLLKIFNYDAEGNLLEAFYYNAEGNLLMAFYYDSEGNLLEKLYYDASGEPIIHWKADQTLLEYKSGSIQYEEIEDNDIFPA